MKKRAKKKKKDSSPQTRAKKKFDPKKWIKSVWSNPAYRFVILFLVYLGVVAVVYPLITNELYFIVEGMMIGTAQIEGFVLSAFSSSTYASGKVVSFNGFPVKIIEECTGIYEILIFIAAIMAFPTTMKKKGIGLAFGVPLMYLFNVVRILVLVVIGSYYYDIFDFMHLYFWQVTLILMITSVWVLWILKVVRREEKVLAAGS